MKIVPITFVLPAMLAVGLSLPAIAASAPTVVLAAPIAAPVRTHVAFLDKPRFLTDMGIGYYAYHHYVWRRYTAGSFKSNAANRLFSLGKAGVALSFAYDRFTAAYHRATSGNDAQLARLAPALNALRRATNSEANQFKKGLYSDATLRSYDKQINDFRRQARGIANIVDIQIGVPGA